MGINKKTVTSNLMGGLGNYLFQIAAAYSYGLKHGHTPVFNFKLASKVHRSIDAYSENILRNINQINSVDQATSKNMAESSFHYNEIPVYDGNVYISGYRQTSKYFEGFDSEIKTLFSCDDKTRQSIYSKFPFFKTKEHKTCSIHVRRGDYVKLQNVHPVQGLNYFMKAVRNVPKDCFFMIFSDDPQWCKENFDGLLSNYQIIEGQSDIEDLYTMSMCDHNIICNSTFSWWSAFLNENKDKIVVAPKRWFGPELASHDTKDIYQDNWIKI